MTGGGLVEGPLYTKYSYIDLTSFSKRHFFCHGPSYGVVRLEAYVKTFRALGGTLEAIGVSRWKHVSPKHV